MEHLPIAKGTSIFSNGLLKKIIEISVVFTVLTLIAIYFAKFRNVLSVTSANTITFIVLGFTTIIHMYNCRSKESIFKIGIISNKLLLATTLLGTIIISLLVVIPYLSDIFALEQISLVSWLFVIGISLTPLIYIELKKKVGRFS